MAAKLDSWQLWRAMAFASAFGLAYFCLRLYQNRAKIWGLVRCKKPATALCTSPFP